MKRSPLVNILAVTGMLFLVIQLAGCAGMAMSSGKKAYADGDYEAAAGYFQQATDEGDPEAMYRLAWLYRSGKGVVKDQAAFDRLMQQAADGGYAAAQTFVGMRFYKGLRTAPDYAKARTYFEGAAKQQDALALYFLGEMYASGTGVAKDLKVAHVYLLLARLQGAPVAEDLLAETRKAFAK